jgi:uncharacterized protein YndB with AHSA1/START domain
VTTSIEVDQFIAHPPAEVWRHLTEPDLLEKWWAPFSSFEPEVGHRFTLDMGGWGHQPGEVLEVEPEERLVYSFCDHWQLTWTLVPEGAGTRLLLEHSGFRDDDPQDRFAFMNMGPGWRDDVLPRLAEAVA